MAFDFSKLNFFSKLDAKARIIVLVGAVVGVIFLVYLLTQFLTGDDGLSSSKVASAPRGLQTVPGGQQTPEFSKAVEQANLQRAQQARLSGQSAIPTMSSIGTAASGTACIICEDQTPNVKSSIDQWVKEGKISADVAKQLIDLANQNVSVDEYARQLDDLVKAGKLTPAQARELLEIYKKQHAGALVQESAKIMDDMIKSGEVPVSEASKLLEMQRQGVSTSDYSNKLQEMVAQGKISPATAQKLLAQYTQQSAKEIVARSIASLKAMTATGQITPDVANELIDLEQRMVPLTQYSSTLDKFVAGGKMTPVVAGKILDEFKAQKAAIGPTGSLNHMVEQAEAAALNDLSDMVKSGKVTQDTADQLAGLMKNNVSLDEFKNNLDRLVKEGKISPDDAKRMLARYAAVKGARDLHEQLANLQANNATPSQYADALKKAVQAGLLTPEEATQLMQEYQAVLNRAPITTVVSTPPAPGGEAFAELQKRLQAGAAPNTTPAALTTDFTTAQVQTTQETAQDVQQRIDDLQAAMSGQAGQLIASWQPPTMMERVGVVATTTATVVTTGKNGTDVSLTEADAQAAADAMPALVKAGTVQFAVLDTEANSDYPDSPIMATIVDGKLKGAKLLGKLRTVKGVAGQMDRISLEFTLMNMDAWPKSRAVNAYAIDPDTARTVMASHVNYHYLQRFGAIMATSFIQGYATGITSSSATTTTGIFGTSTTTPALSPGEKLAVGLGQVGTALGDVTKNYVNIPPTVKVDSGVGLGILFMSDVT